NTRISTNKSRFEASSIRQPFIVTVENDDALERKVLTCWNLTAVLVSVKVAGVNRATDAVTLYVPVMLLAIGTGDVAMPNGSVTTVTLALPANVELAPVEGAVNVTVTFSTAFDDTSVTCTSSA